MNAAVRALALLAINVKIVPFYVQNGYEGLHSGKIYPLDDRTFLNLSLTMGGSRIGSSRFEAMKQEKVRMEMVEQLLAKNIETLVVIGGDGSYFGASLLAQAGINVIGLPGTIDNDVSSTGITIGFDTSLNGIVTNVNAIQDTARSHNMCHLVEVMGRHSPDLAIHAAIATGANLVITNENVMQPVEITKKIKEFLTNGATSLIILISENIYGIEKLPSLSEIAKLITSECGIQTRASVLGYSQRGGKPTAAENVNAALMAKTAIDNLINGKKNFTVGLNGTSAYITPIEQAVKIVKPSRKEMILLANTLGNSR
ncbi:unnamed protein product [Didymodactylos carnosus]|uniref:6-phosphofructokinase n=1 Tax=Didymodactylos carnosus TaxID=1234261 RepID=A0A8S2GGX5_9BILA|nr:unnamed protein product [Didymodactylos carnosus]CAF3491616.1 unnamed protein product [Didymodactylos carnosus]